jgi:hypothetical protein
MGIFNNAKRAALKGQVPVLIVENGPDPFMSEYWTGLAERTSLELSAAGAPTSIRVGMKGDPTTTWYGDRGPLGGLPAPSYGALNALPSLNAEQALPNTSSPGAGSTGLKGLVAQYQ